MKNKSKFLVVIMIFAFAFSACFGISNKSDILKNNGKPTVFYSQTLSGGGSSVEYYGRNALLQLSRGDVFVFAYDALVEGIKNSQESIAVTNGTSKLSASELSIVFDAYLRDHPEHFWLGKSYNYTHISNDIKEVRPEYILSGENLELAKEKFNASVNNVLAGITAGMSDFEKEVYLHDTLAAKVSYVTDAPHAHDAYGALVDGQTVCEGYAEAL